MQALLCRRPCAGAWPFLLALLLGGCLRLAPVAHYDETIDQGVTSLQRGMEGQLAQFEEGLLRLDLLEAGATERQEVEGKLAWEASAPFYRQFRVDLRLLRTRAECRPHNELTAAQLAALEKILDEQEAFHQRGFESAEDIVDLRAAWTRGFTAVLKLELAKRR